MKTLNLKKYISEGLLIVFSVLFALFINGLAESHRTGQRKEAAIESLRQELYRNSTIIKNWKSTHSKILGRLEGILKGEDDDLRAKLSKNDFLDLDLLIPEGSLFDAILTDTAWESAKSSGILSEFDFDMTQVLTKTYSMQKVFSERTMMKLIDLLFQREIHDTTDLDINLRLLMMRVGELNAQENLLGEFYTEAIGALNE